MGGWEGEKVDFLTNSTSVSRVVPGSPTLVSGAVSGYAYCGGQMLPAGASVGWEGAATSRGQHANYKATSWHWLQGFLHLHDVPYCVWSYLCSV